MKRLIRLILNLIPRPILQRMAGWAVPLLGLIYVGRGRECPVCGTKRRKFLPYGYVTSRENALCPNCLSLERHRLLWLWLQRESDLFERCPKLLHVAPEVCLMRHLRKAYKGHEVDYVTADLESPLADMHFDIQQIPLADNSFDVIFCNHIMEHVEDDLRAMSELYRVMSHGGWGVVLSPVELERQHTFEDDTITDEAERTRIFGQYDHRRVYGQDYADRLRSVGFEVEDLDYAATFTEEDRQRFALPVDHLYIVRKQ
ncbi:MAG: class I SAM-dependent methyltransferase [Rikenellaceae bacterium]|nr:class I SAM-dependent methyltransferase [Rikenellaceae bacterium]